MQGRLDLMGPAMNVQKELMSIPDFGAEDETPFAKEKKLVANLKKAILILRRCCSEADDEDRKRTGSIDEHC